MVGYAIILRFCGVGSHRGIGDSEDHEVDIVQRLHLLALHYQTLDIRERLNRLALHYQAHPDKESSVTKRVRLREQAMDTPWCLTKVPLIP